MLYRILADAYARMGQNSEAILCCQRALEKDPTFSEAYYLLGDLLRQSNPVRATECFRSAIKLDPHYRLALQALGEILVGTPQTRREGIAVLKQTVQCQPPNGWIHIYLANAYWSEHEVEHAENHYQFALKCEPNNKEFIRWYHEFLEAKKNQRCQEP